jgi:hypothetical protein
MHRLATRLSWVTHGRLSRVLAQSGTKTVLSHVTINNLRDLAEFYKNPLVRFGMQGTLSPERTIVKDLGMRLRRSEAALSTEDQFDFSATMITLEKRMRN